MTRVCFVSANGGRVEVDAAAGERLLDIAQAAGQPLEGTCEGQMACSTCHVILEKDEFGLFPPPSEEEEDLLDLASHAGRYSRLACQLVLDGSIKRLTVNIPPDAKDMQGR